MYSYQIQQLLESSNYNIDSETYINICSTSPQIKEIKYSPFGNYFEILVSDGYWKFTVYRKNNKRK